MCLDPPLTRARTAVYVSVRNMAATAGFKLCRLKIGLALSGRMPAASVSLRIKS